MGTVAVTMMAVVVTKVAVATTVAATAAVAEATATTTNYNNFIYDCHSNGAGDEY